MSQCDALVVETSGNEVWVEVAGRAPACGSCENSDACRDGSPNLGTGPRRYRLENRIGARVGDHVQLIVADGTLWRAAAASYMLPALLAIAGAFIGQPLAGDAGAAAGAGAGIACGLLLLRRKELGARHRGSFLSLHVPTQEIRFKE